MDEGWSKRERLVVELALHLFLQALLVLVLHSRRCIIALDVAFVHGKVVQHFDDALLAVVAPMSIGVHGGAQPLQRPKVIRAQVGLGLGIETAQLALGSQCPLYVAGAEQLGRLGVAERPSEQPRLVPVGLAVLMGKQEVVGDGRRSVRLAGEARNGYELRLVAKLCF